MSFSCDFTVAVQKDCQFRISRFYLQLLEWLWEVLNKLTEMQVAWIVVTTSSSLHLLAALPFSAFTGISAHEFCALKHLSYCLLI